MMPRGAVNAAELARWREAGTLLAGAPDGQVYSAWSSAGKHLLRLAGHGRCGGWRFDPVTQETLCACGKDPFARPAPVLLMWDGQAAPALTLMAAADGHSRCGGYHTAGQIITCTCGQIQYEVALVEAGAA